VLLVTSGFSAREKDADHVAWRQGVLSSGSWNARQGRRSDPLGSRSLEKKKKKRGLLVIRTQRDV